MPAESIASLRKPGFPKPVTTENGVATLIEYIGDTTTLAAAAPGIGTTWGDFQGTVRTTSLIPVEGNEDVSELSVTMELITQSDSEATGDLESETYEIDWAVVARSLYEHPQFALGQGGANALIEGDIINIQYWETEKDESLKKLYKFTNPANLYVTELSTNAKLFAKGILIGQSLFEDYAPVARKTSTYSGGLPPESNAGQKEIPADFPSLPTGYEWRKTADRNVTVGKRTRWEKQEEWVGAKKVLHDKDQIFWEPPA